MFLAWLLWNLLLLYVEFLTFTDDETVYPLLLRPMNPADCYWFWMKRGESIIDFF